MNDHIQKVMSLAILFVALFAAEAASQTVTELPFTNRGMSGRSICFPLKTGIIKKEDLDKAREDKGCIPAKYVDIDFDEQTLLFWHVGGDCHMRAVIKGVSLDEINKVVTVEIDNISGGCRAGGLVEGFLTVDKIPDDFGVQIIENQIDVLNYRKDGFPISIF